MTPSHTAATHTGRALRPLPRAGMSLLEVLCATAILAVVGAAVSNGMVAVATQERSAKDRAQVMVICRSLAERVMGGTWDKLGINVDSSSIANQNSWSWNRRLHPSNAATANPPMDEVSSNPLNRLDKIVNASGDAISPAVETVKSGIQNLQIYLEYYQLSLFTSMLTSTTPQQTWEAAINTPINPYNFDDTSAFTMSLNSINTAVMCRVVARWTPRGVSGNQQTQVEIDFMRKK
jgi:prepilin-type N-terminal cleavage/methylation domain-containing protein